MLHVVAGVRRTPVRACRVMHRNKLTVLANARANKVENPMTIVTTHNQSDPPVVRRRSAKVRLTCTGLTIWVFRNRIRGVRVGRVVRTALLIYTFILPRSRHVLLPEQGVKHLDHHKIGVLDRSVELRRLNRIPA